jgi:hypothetical protein
MSRFVTVNLDDPSDLQRVVEEHEAYVALRRTDPELRKSLLKLASRMPTEEGDEIRQALEVSPPAAVLASFFDQLYAVSLAMAPQREPAPQVVAPVSEPAPQKSVEETLTAFVRGPIEAWLIEDPRRLRGVVLEACRFSKNDRRVVEGVLTLANSLGIELRLAGDIVASALRDARRHPQKVAQ